MTEKTHFAEIVYTNEILGWENRELKISGKTLNKNKASKLMTQQTYKKC